MFRFHAVLCLAVLLLSAVQTSARVNLPDFSELAETAGAAVVNLSTTRSVKTQDRIRDFFKNHPRSGPMDEMLDQFDRFFKDDQSSKRQRSMGSGFLISRDGYIVTNNHVVEDAQEIKVNLRGVDKPLTARLVGRDPEVDLALVKIEGVPDLPFLELGDSANLKVGAWVLAIGNPFGLQHTVTAGIVSAKGRVIGAGPFDDFIQTDASINPGNSGGPLLDMDGKVVGINTAIVASAQGIGFAIPVDLVKQTVADLKAQKEIKRGWLGVTIQDVDETAAKALGMPEAKGALVSSVMEGDPAAKAGVKVGDVIVAVAGQTIKDAAALLRSVAALKPGGKTELTVWRKGSEVKLTAVLGQRDTAKLGQDGQPQREEPARSELGLSLRPLLPEEAKKLGLPQDKGLMVTDMTPDGPAAQSSMQVGDVVLEANQTPVGSGKELQSVVEKDGRAKGAVILLIRRGKLNLFASLPVGPAQ